MLEDTKAHGSTSYRIFLQRESLGASLHVTVYPRVTLDVPRGVAYSIKMKWKTIVRVTGGKLIKTGQATSIELDPIANYFLWVKCA